MSLASVPGPKGIPILGMALEFSKDPFAYAKQVGRFRPVAAVPFPGMKLVYVLEPELVEQVLQSQWKQLGIDIRIRNEPARVFFGETVTKRKFTGLAMFAWISSPRNVPRTTLHSEMIPVEATNWAGQNYTGFSNAEMDRTIDDVEVKCDPQENMALWHKLQRIYAEELPALPLYYRANAFILPRGLKGVTPTGHQYPSTNWVENWTR